MSVNDLLYTVFPAELINIPLVVLRVPFNISVGLITFYFLASIISVRPLRDDYGINSYQEYHFFFKLF